MKQIVRPMALSILICFLMAIIMMLLSWMPIRQPLVAFGTCNVTDVENARSNHTSAAGTVAYAVKQEGWNISGKFLPAVSQIKKAANIIEAAPAKITNSISVDTFSINPDWAVEGESGLHLGRSVASAGDVNGDGYSDVVIGALSYRNGTGRVFVYYGSANGLATTYAWAAEGAQIGNNFGSSVASAGDINNDGYGDVIIGESGFDNRRGRVFVYFGSAAGLSYTPGWSMEGNASAPSSSQGGGNYGSSVAGAGDVNHDGFDDIIVGEPLYFPFYNQIPIGRAYVYYGSATGISNTAAWVAQGSLLDYLGSSVASAGDVNGDGFSDVIVGARTERQGYARVFNGSATGLSSTASWSASGSSSARFVYFGASVSGAGDVNGDGFSDLIIGATGCFCNPSPASNYYGGVYVYQGSATGVSATPSWTLISNNPGVGLGSAVASAGDFNKDGYADVILGENSYNKSKGLALLYYGSSSGLNDSNFIVAGPGNLNNSNFGYSVAGAGDVNNDKYSDVIVGIPGDSRDSLVTKGLAFGYYGKLSELGPLPLLLLHFNAIFLNNEAVLQWTTTNETNIDYFEVQRSTEGNRFSAVTKLNAKGYTGGKSLYTFTDHLTVTDKIYYRLKWVDINGKPAYSNTIVLRNTLKKLWGVHPNVLTYSQPFTFSINNREEPKQLSLQIIDVNGRTVTTLSLEVMKGYQTIPLNVHLNKGNYLVVLRGIGQKAQVEKIVVQ